MRIIRAEISIPCKSGFRQVINNDCALLIFASDLLCRRLIFYAKPDLHGKGINEETF